MKYAITSTDFNPDYYSLLPMTCYSWERLGYIPVVLHVGDLPDIVQDKCPSAMFFRIPSVEGVKDSTLAQISRLFAIQFVSTHDNDILISADADMIVMKDIFTHTGNIASYGYDLTGRSELPICYLKASPRQWHDLMPSTGLFQADLPEKAYSLVWEDYWSVDQQLLTKRAKEYGFEKITFVDRGFAGAIAANRWDRYCWDKKPTDIIDVHMLRGPGHWPALIDMAKFLFPETGWEWMAKFKKEIYGN